MTFNDIFKSNFLENVTGVSIFDGNRGAVGIQKIRVGNAGPYVVVDGDSDIAGRIYVRLPRVIHNGFWPKSLCRYFGIQFLYECIRMFQHPVIMTVYDFLCFFFCQKRTCFIAETASFIFLLQTDTGSVFVIISDTEFFADIDAVQLFTQGFIRQVVKIKASDFIAAIDRMPIRLRDRPKALP